MTLFSGTVTTTNYFYKEIIMVLRLTGGGGGGGIKERHALYPIIPPPPVLTPLISTHTSYLQFPLESLENRGKSVIHMKLSFDESPLSSLVSGLSLWYCKAMIKNNYSQVVRQQLFHLSFLKGNQRCILAVKTLVIATVSW